MMKLTATIRYAYRITAGQRSRILAGAVAGCLRVGCGLLFIWVSKQLIDIAVGDMSGTLFPYALLLIGCIGLETVCSVVQGYWETSTEATLKNSLRYRLFVQVMHSPWNGRERFHTGDVVNRLEEDVRVVTEALCKTFPATLVTVLQALGAFLFLCALDATLAWGIVGILPVCLLLGKFYTRHMRQLTADIRVTDSRVQSLLQENLQHRTLILSLLRADVVASRLACLQGGLFGKVMRRNHFTLFTRAMVLTGFGTGYLVAFLWGVHQLQQGFITFGVLTAFLQLVGQVQRPTADFSRQLPAFIYAATSTGRIAELEDLTVGEKQEPTCLTTLQKTATEEEKVLTHPATKHPLQGICFDAVTFAYLDGKRCIFKAFSHDFAPGSSTAIIGETGTGKSTLIRLMLALLRPDSGGIHLYNKEGKRQKASTSTRSTFAYVPQGNSLLSGTIRDNLLLGNLEATEAQLRKALYTAVADFVYALPLGLDTPCGESGAGLSEGQAQRIAIARGLLLPGKILLLDEFSSALDSRTEQLLMDRLTNEAEGKTLIIITHRMEIAHRCDEIIELSK